MKKNPLFKKSPDPSYDNDESLLYLIGILILKNYFLQEGSFLLKTQNERKKA